MPLKPFTVNLDDDLISGLQRLGEVHRLSASAIARLAVKAAIDDPSIILGKPLSGGKRMPSRSKLIQTEASAS